VECLTKDREALLAFFNFPAEHWDHLRTTNPIESVFATVRHRTVRTKGSLSSTTARLMVFKLVIAASKTWRRLKGTNHLPKIVAGVRFKDGIEVLEVPENHRLIAPRHLKSLIAQLATFQSRAAVDDCCRDRRVVVEEADLEIRSANSLGPKGPRQARRRASFALVQSTQAVRI
jgi:hypothetical protein